METLQTEQGWTVVHDDGKVVAVLVGGDPKPLREEGLATIYLIEAVKTLCKARAWPEEAIDAVIHSALHFNAPRVHGVGGPGLRGRIFHWKEVHEDADDQPGTGQ